MIIVLVGAVVLAPVVVMADLRRWRPLPVLLWLLGTAAVVLWVETRDAAGEQRGLLTGIGWLVLGVLCGGGSVAAGRRGTGTRPRHGD
ncbi:hypothetical protein ACI8AV_04965 [Geodermatophilus sp. SYSU D00804]